MYYSYEINVQENHLRKELQRGIATSGPAERKHGEHTNTMCNRVT